MKIYIPLLLLIILTISFSSCAKKEDSTAATTTDPAAITGETMTIGSIDYTSSLLSSCYDFDLTSTAGDSVYGKEQIFLYIFSLKNVEEVRTKKSHIHILESETLSREYRVTETAQEIVSSIPDNCA